MPSTRALRTLAPAAACSLALMLVAAAPPARADCRVYEEPDWCDMMWTVEDTFWVGEYAVEAGPVRLVINGQPLHQPAEPMSMATIFQLDTDLVIDHPEVVLTAGLQGVGPGEGSWDWSGELPDWELLSLGDIETMLGCNNARLPRWRAPVKNPSDGPDLTLDLAAITPFNLVGKLYGSGTYRNTTFDLRRQINFTRDTYPVEGLDLETIASDEACDVICSDQPWRCPDG